MAIHYLPLAYAGHVHGHHASPRAAVQGNGRPLAGHSSSQMQSMQEVIRSVTAGRATERAHLLAPGRAGLPQAAPSSSLSHSWSRSMGRVPVMHSASASPSLASGSAGLSSSSWLGTAPRSCPEAIPEEDPEAEQPSRTVELAVSADAL